MRLGPVRLLVVINLLLSAGLAWMWLDEHGQWRNITWSAPAPLLPEVNQLAAAAVLTGPQAVNPGQYLAILERPMFAPDRRPPPPPDVAPPDPLANIQLVGVFSGANGGVLARVDGVVRRVKVNESVGAWILKSVEGRSVTFAQGEQNRQIALEYSVLGERKQLPGGQSPVANRPVVSSASTVVQQAVDEARERNRRANELRAAHGLPVIPY